MASTIYIPVFWMCFISSGGNCQFVQPEYAYYYNTPSTCARIIERDKKSILNKIKKGKKQPDIFGSNCVSLVIDSPSYTSEEMQIVYETKNIENSFNLDVSAYKTKVIKIDNFDELEKDIEEASKPSAVKIKEPDYALNEAPRSFIVDCMRYMSLSKNDCEKSWFIKN